MSLHDINFIKNLQVKTFSSTLFIIISCKITSEKEKMEYYAYVNTFIDGLKIESDERVINIINEPSIIKVKDYYSADLTLDNLKFINLLFDFNPDTSFDNSDRNLFRLLVTVSDTRIANDFEFITAIINKNTYDSLLNNKYSDIIFVLSEEKNTVVHLSNKDNIKYKYPPSEFQTEFNIKEKQVELVEDIETETINEDNKNAYIYVAYNDYMTVLKIGRSSNVETRLKALSNHTCVPVSFKEGYKRKFVNTSKVERYILNYYQNLGLRIPNREFINAPLNDVIKFIENIDENEILLIR